LFLKLRDSRTVFGELGPKFQEGEATIFLGLFNAESYLDSIQEQLASQTVALPVIVVDNSSSDETWIRIQSWLTRFPGQIILVRNPINLGASGSLYVNSDLIKTPWFITMHQDDFYKRNHAQTLLEAIKGSDLDTICITTEMGSLGLDGKPLPTPPRASWLLPDFEPATIFTSNLKMHNVPYPAAAFRSRAFFQHNVPWETTAFPDTEWVLSVAALGKFSFVEKETMFYRENPGSESHSIENEEKTFGASLALLRVFGSKTFEELCSARTPEERPRFAASVLEGIRARLGESEHRELVSTFACQKMAASWGYAEPLVNEELIRSFGARGANFPVTLLSNLNNFFDHTPAEKQGNPAPELRSGTTKFQSQTFKLVSIRLFGRMPTWARRNLTKIAGRLIRFLNIKSIWNFRWK
jgi:glycosyltransferase involved in cell wall biosynthesis